MKVAAIALILISIGVIVYFSTLEPPGPTPVAAPEPMRDDVTLRSTRAGDVVGFVGERGARTWLGIPYAEPPVGERRWQPPLAPRSWDGVKETVASRARCPQLVANTGSGAPDDPAELAGDEDCLYLNVYAPANARRLPVMVWIHGGGNSVGTGATYDGSVLATTGDVVVITINYRLGPLGWFNHPALAVGDPVADSGNFGTLDIIQALIWTRNNVAEFGGDPDRVTVFGESAGGSNVLTLVASPMARGLFHRGIVQSGRYATITAEEAQRYASDGGHPHSASEITNRLLIADELATDADDARRVQEAMGPAELRSYLKNKSANELFAPFDSANFGMLPTPEAFADGEVLPSLDARAIFTDSAQHNSVPLILGTTRDEQSLFMAALPKHVVQQGDVPRLRNPAGYWRAVRYESLAWKARGVDSLAEHLVASGNRAVFAYRFDWDEQGEVDGVDLSTVLGAAHGVELPFVFGDFESGYFGAAYYPPSPGRDALARSVTAYWTQFAASGDPGVGRDGAQPRWLAWGTDDKTTLILDTPSDQGIRMTEGVVTAASIKAQLATDPEIADNAERCALYVRIADYTAQFDPEEFARFGPRGCAAFDPDALRAP